MVRALEELRIERQDAVEIEGAAIEHAIEGDGATLGLVDDGVRVDGADARLDRLQFGRRDEIGLVEEDDVGEADLLLRLRAVLEGAEEMLGIGDRDHRIELGLRLDLVVHEEGLRHRRRIGEPGGFHQDAVEAARPLHQPLDHADEIATHGAADAAVVHLEDFLVRLDDEIVVDADLAELVDDDGVLLAVVLGEDTVQQRRLAGAEVAGENGDGICVSDIFGSLRRRFKAAARWNGAFCRLSPCQAIGGSVSRSSRSSQSVFMASDPSAVFGHSARGRSQ